MSDQFLGEIELFAFGFAPKGWALCAGQTLSIQQNQALFALIGTTFGGDGIRTFNLPDLRSRVAVGQGSGPGLTTRVVGQTGGEEQHTLLTAEMPLHGHSLQALANQSTATNTDVPGPAVVLAQTNGVDRNGNAFAMNIYAADNAPGQSLSAAALTPAGAAPHPNLMPYLAGNFCIALQGIFPSQN
jgi:microcystin-dependent protein